MQYSCSLQNLDNFTDGLEHYYRDMTKQKTYVLIGDINANILETDNKTERYLDFLHETGLSTNAELSRKRKKMDKPKIMPVDEDIRKFSTYLNKFGIKLQ